MSRIQVASWQDLSRHIGRIPSNGRNSFKTCDTLITGPHLHVGNVLIALEALRSGAPRGLVEVPRDTNDRGPTASIANFMISVKATATIADNRVQLSWAQSSPVSGALVVYEQGANFEDLCGRLSQAKIDLYWTEEDNSLELNVTSNTPTPQNTSLGVQGLSITSGTGQGALEYDPNSCIPSMIKKDISHDGMREMSKLFASYFSDPREARTFTHQSIHLINETPRAYGDFTLNEDFSILLHFFSFFGDLSTSETKSFISILNSFFRKLCQRNPEALEQVNQFIAKMNQ